MAAAKIAMVALGVGGAWAVAHFGAQQALAAPAQVKRQRRRVGRQAHRTAAEVRPNAVQSRPHSAGGQPSASASGGSSTPASAGLAVVLPLLLSALLAIAAALAEELRPAGYSAQEWQQLTRVAAMCTALAGAAAWLSFRRRAAAAAAAAPTSLPVGAAAPVVAAPLAARAPPQDPSGLWIKDKVASDSMEEACDIMQLGGLVRTAIKLIKGVEIRCDAATGQFTMSVLSGILWFKITEAYPLDGGPRHFRRRDLRRGKHVGHVERCPATGGILLHVSWADPLGGSGYDLFHMPTPDVLHVITDMMVGGRPLRYRMVYRRKQ